MSSDYVFDGAKRDAVPGVRPDAAALGLRALEARGRAGGGRARPERHTIVRSSWLFGAGGRCFPKTMLRLPAERDELDVVDDQIGCPTFTGHLARRWSRGAARACRASCTSPAPGQCSWFEFAREIVAVGGRRLRDATDHHGQYPPPAPRPAYSVLRSERGAPVLPDWRDGLRIHVRDAWVRA